MTDLSILTQENVIEAAETLGTDDAAKIARYLLEMKRAPKEATDLVAQLLGSYEAPEEVEAEDEDEEISGSIVAGTYKAGYAEAGHPDHCGDWLAKALEGRFEVTVEVDGKQSTQLDRDAWNRFLSDNGLNPGRWSHLNNGQLRMTGGNALRSQVFRNGGTYILDGQEHKAPRAWMAEKTAALKAREQERRVRKEERKAAKIAAKAAKPAKKKAA